MPYTAVNTSAGIVGNSIRPLHSGRTMDKFVLVSEAKVPESFLSGCGCPDQQRKLT